ncbi:MAG: LON peptidase substrate-binding domain-containing protein [Acidiferrobacterales bacterium]
MSRNPFTPSFEELPKTVPIFPLSGAIVLPGAQLTLNIFEPRYLNMVFDASGADRMIGMIQPVHSGEAQDNDNIHKTGCAGRITTFRETDDGRLLIVLTGVCRFDVIKEIATTRGYRRVLADWGPYADDLSEGDSPSLESEHLIDTLTPYFDAKNVQADWESLKKMSSASLVNLLATNLPFEPEEKQALIEAKTIHDRTKVLIVLSQMSLSSSNEPGDTRH